jgi:hydrophobic/amphiphilic exporter-1 (mainly G- bacteria), HAE1 family
MRVVLAISVTLYITPVIYLYLDGVDRRLRRSLEPQLEVLGEEARKPESAIAAE